MKTTFIVLSSLFFLRVEGTQSKFEETVYRDAVAFVNECGSKSMTLCLKERALRYVERLPSNFDIGGSIIVKPNDVDRNSRKYGSVSLPEDAVARENLVDKVLLERIADYLTTHTLELKFPEEAINDIKRTMDEGRKKKDKKHHYWPYMMMFQVKAAALAILAMKFIGMIAFKALVISKVAFTIASVIALKKIVDQKHTSTYEVLATHPVHEHDDYSHYDRSFDQAEHGVITNRNVS